ncbi:MAG TPA: MFS transporter [Pseudonocardiaceae bacterium]|jgi:MFS family permease
MVSESAVSQEARRARFGVSAVFVICGTGLSTWAASVPAVAQKLGLNAGQVGIGVFALAVGAVLALLCAGPLLTLISSRTGVVLGAAVMCTGLPLVAFAPNLPVLVGTLAVLGAGNSLVDVSMNAHAARVEGVYGRSIFAGFHAFWSIGGLAGSGIAAVMALWQVPITTYFTAVGVVLFLLAVGMARWLLFRGPDQGQGDGSSPAFALPSKALLALGLIAFVGFVAEGSVNDWSAYYLRNITRSAEAFASLGYFAFSITMIVVRLIADRMVRRVGVVRFIRAAAITTVAGFALLVTVRVSGVGLVAFAVIGIGVSGIVPMAWSAASKKRPESPGQAIAAVAACGYVGFLTGPVIVTGLTDWLGLPFALACVGAFSGVVWFLAPTMRAPASTDIALAVRG